MRAMKGHPDVGDRIDAEVIQPLVDANASLVRTDFPDFNDPGKPGDGKERMDRLANLVASFECPELDFSRPRGSATTW